MTEGVDFMPGLLQRWGPKLGASLVGLTLAVGSGCSERPEPKGRPSAQVADFRKIRFANDWVVVPFQGGLTTSKIPGPTPGFVPRTGDRVTLSDASDGEIFLAADQDSLRFYHSTPGSEQLGRFRNLAETGKLFIVARGTTAVVTRVVEGDLPDGLLAIEIRLIGEKGGTAWVSDPFVRPSGS